MSTIKRTRGDNYAIIATLKVNGYAVDLTGSTVTFSYVKSGTTTPSSIDGLITDAANGVVQFLPSVTDFQEVGTYLYDIQRVSSGIKTTHALGQLIIEDDVNKG
jgi:hypothetical protein